jgi:hypothetical protein
VEAPAYTKKLLKAIAKGKAKIPTPTMAIFNPAKHLGSYSEKYALAAEKYLKENPHRLIAVKGQEKPRMKSRRDPISTTEYKMLTQVRYLRSMADPGEAVGLLASQG